MNASNEGSCESAPSLLNNATTAKIHSIIKLVEKLRHEWQSLRGWGEYSDNFIHSRLGPFLGIKILNFNILGRGIQK